MPSVTMISQYWREQQQKQLNTTTATTTTSTIVSGYFNIRSFITLILE